ncbi:tRNA (guanosine(46)-N7)-methyltransferase TrmB [Fluviicola taffensis]|uniref:tRNA (guanine-N(7)-)-methyltransferase n=1 Tax=Fluviicola taffensis (strain DSM 16823 / NCIMB 13979 / RW262) TaxID=755732 RepID=F2IBI1_FLUTR|nr:tRNA (guanosine(46)-N7)-methyltransferase TrmB [Fluviicola taffensis]AEA44289.1 tRNA (guanine-N(7)-)-methyltransferase [Fluviicola taffensis DSM 16823]
MAKNKLKRFAEMKSWNNVFEPTLDPNPQDVFPLKGKWRTDYFKNDNPIVLELGCGKGEYTVGLAKHYPNKNFIGVDIKGSRMFVGAKEALDENLPNVAFLRTKVDFIEQYFLENEVDEIWLTFSDPQPEKPKKRLSSRPFIERYQRILKNGGLVHLKTDSDLLFESTEEQINEHKYEVLELTWDLYKSIPADLDPTIRDILHIKTHYEQLFTAKGSVIKYCSFRIH